MNNLTVEQRVALYVQRLQEAAIETGYGVISKDTLLKTVRAYVAKYKPTDLPTDAVIPPSPQPKPVVQESYREESNVINLFSRKKP